MQRRAFFHLCLGTTAAVAAARLGFDTAFASDGTWRAVGEALFPGAPLQVEAAQDAPDGLHVRLRVDHDGREHLLGLHPLAPGGTLTLETPYPHDDLCAGTYRVHLDLIDAGGAMVETRSAGAYRLARFRFSA